MKGKAALIILLASGSSLFMLAQDDYFIHETNDEDGAFVFEWFENPIPKHHLSDLDLIGPVKSYRKTVYMIDEKKSAPNNRDLYEKGDLYVLNEQSHIIEIQHGGGTFHKFVRPQTEFFKYDLLGRLVEVETEVRSTDGILTDNGMTTFYSYDSKNRVIGVWTKTRPTKYIYNYDELGRPVREGYKDASSGAYPASGEGYSTYLYEKLNPTRKVSVTKKEYSTSSFESNQLKIQTTGFICDSTGKILEKLTEKKDGTFADLFVFEYDGFGNKISEKRRRSGGYHFDRTNLNNWSEVTVYSYDDYGNVVSKIVRSQTDGERIETYTFTYDNVGNWVSKEKMVNGELKDTYERSYDKVGNWITENRFRGGKLYTVEKQEIGYFE